MHHVTAPIVAAAGAWATLASVAVDGVTGFIGGAVVVGLITLLLKFKN
ncbi:hypothetical protein [Salinimonas marina]